MQIAMGVLFTIHYNNSSASTDNDFQFDSNFTDYRGAIASYYYQIDN